MIEIINDEMQDLDETHSVTRQVDANLLPEIERQIATLYVINLKTVDGAALRDLDILDRDILKLQESVEFVFEVGECDSEERAQEYVDAMLEDAANIHAHPSIGSSLFTD